MLDWITDISISSSAGGQMKAASYRVETVITDTVIVCVCTLKKFSNLFIANILQCWGSSLVYPVILSISDTLSVLAGT